MECPNLKGTSYVTSQAARRIYLFQRPVSCLDSSSTCTSRNGAETPPWWDSSFPLEVALPRVVNQYEIASHIGVIVIDEEICTNDSLTPQHKLLFGTVYEHKGPDMESCQDRRGMEINAENVKHFTALELIGDTKMTDIQLDSLLTEILRVGGNPDNKPVYHTLYWNCQDIATRFALVTADNGAAAIQVLANMFDTAKLRAAACIEIAWRLLSSTVADLTSRASFAGFSISAAESVQFIQLTSPLLVYTVLSKASNILREEIRRLTWEYKALQDHCVWEAALERQFPELQGLGHGHQVWQKRADDVGTIPKLLGPFLFFVCGEVVRW